VGRRRRQQSSGSINSSRCLVIKPARRRVSGWDSSGSWLAMVTGIAVAKRPRRSSNKARTLRLLLLLLLLMRLLLLLRLLLSWQLLLVLLLLKRLHGRRCLVWGVWCSSNTSNSVAGLMQHACEEGAAAVITCLARICKQRAAGSTVR
jgi:hypothetical protein